MVLNASYEPLCVVPDRRAAVLVLSDKAVTVHESGTELHSERRTIAVPSVVRLRYYVKVPYERTMALSRRAVFHRDRSTCQYCGSTADSIDHVVPRSRGGLHVWENVVAACRRCNAAKADRLLDEISMKLQSRPTPPRELSWIMVAVADIPEMWRQYLQPSRLASA